MKGSWNILTFKGVNLYIHWTFWLLVAWVMLENARTGNSVQQLGWSMLFLVLVFSCVALHEFGHALVAAKFKIKARNIVLLPIGGIASIEKFPDNPKQELAISIAGPLVNIIIAAVLFVFLTPFSENIANLADVRITHGHDLVLNLLIANISLAIFNLIPAFPMDGGRILRALIGFRLNYVRATSIATVVGKVIATVFVIFGILSYNLLLAVIGFFIVFSADAEEYYLRLKTLVKGIKLKEVLMYEYDKLESKTTAKEASGILMNTHNKYFMVMDGPMPLGTVNRMEIVKAIAEMKYDLLVSDLMKTNLQYLDANEQVETVLEQLAITPERIYPVMEHKQFIGVISFNHIIEYLLIHKADSGEFARIKSLASLV